MKIVNQKLDVVDFCVSIAEGKTPAAWMDDGLLEKMLIEGMGREIGAIGDKADGLEDFDNEAGTVEARYRVVASPDVGKANEALGVVDRRGAEVCRP